MNIVVIVIAAACVIGVVVWRVSRARAPLGATTHEIDTRETPNELFYDGGHRTAGADVESMDPESLGGDQSPPKAT